MSKVVVITGASGGIGAALAKLLAKQGHRVVLAARREAELRVVAEGLGGPTAVVVADVTHRADVDRIRDTAVSRFGHVDVWINNAGRGIARGVLDLTDDDIDEMVRVNVKSALYGMQAILPHFKERGAGHLINVSSALSKFPFAPIRSAYAASKAALNNLTDNARAELATSHPGVHVSTVLPGPVATEFAENVLHSKDASGQRPPASMMQSAHDVARAISDLIEHPEAEIFTNPAFAPKK